MKGAATQSAEILILDPEPTSRDALALALSREGHRLGCFDQLAPVLAAIERRPPACILFDVLYSTPEPLLNCMDAQGSRAVLIALCRSDELAPALEVLGRGVSDFVEKPIEPEYATARVRQAIANQRRTAAEPEAGSVSTRALNLNLTVREREVLVAIARGGSSKEIGRQFLISPRTVEVHRARIMEKLGAKNTAQLVRMLMTAPPA